jgi:uncharacterized membrane protein
MSSMWAQLWENHRGTVTGVASGIFLGMIYLFAGFWDMLVFTLIVYIGYYIGKKRDRGQKALDIADIYEWIMSKWKLF